MIKLIELEWRKLERKKVFGEAVVYWAILMFMPAFMLRNVFADMPGVDFGQSYSHAIQLMVPIQMGFLLFGASLINHVFIEEYKNKTIALSFGYPISRKRLVLAKVLFILLAVFVFTLASFVLSGIATYLLDRVFDLIAGEPTMADLLTYISRMIIQSFVVAIVSLVPLFLFGLWKRAVIPTVTCAIVLMQLPNFRGMLHITLQPDLIYAIFSLLGVASAYLSVKMVDRVGDL